MKQFGFLIVPFCNQNNFDWVPNMGKVMNSQAMHNAPSYVKNNNFFKKKMHISFSVILVIVIFTSIQNNLNDHKYLT